MTDSATTKQTTPTSYYKKRLEGININGALLDLWKDAYSKNVTPSFQAEPSLPSPMTKAPHSQNEAIDILRNAGDPSKIKRKKKKALVMPIRVLQSIRLLVPSESLEQAVQTANIGLAFTPPRVPEMTAERKRYLERMEKLRLKSEETKYTRITNNIKDQRQEDDKTARSMTYAASVGLNMIVAPISFGTFMFFFSGGIFDYFFPQDESMSNRNPSGVDIKRLIVGVVSGVIMMIIEMVLFVIRSHEFDSHTTRKKKKRGIQPFGSYSANSAMTYTDGASKPAKAAVGGDLASKKTN